MKLRMKLRSKMLLSVLIVATIVFLASIGYLTSKLESITLKNAYNFVDATAREYANSIQANFNNEMGMARSMAEGFHFYNELSSNELKENSIRTLRGIAIDNPNFLSVWVSWELGTIDKNWNKPYGRERYTFYWENNQLKFVTDRKNETGDDPNSLYYALKTSKIEAVVDPYWFTYTGSNKKVLETSVCVPLLDNGKFVGLFGFDFELTRYQDYINNIKPYEGSYAMLLSQNGTIVAHTFMDNIGFSIDSIYKNESKAFNIIEKLKKGENFSISITDQSGKKYYGSFASFKIGNSSNPWTLAIVAPSDIIVKESNAVARRSQTVIIIGLIILAIVVWVIAYSITRPLVKTTKVLRDLANGQIDLNKKIDINTGDEIQDIGNSVNILIDSLYKTTNFAKEIGKGNLNVSFNKLSENDVLGEALLEMRKSLDRAKELDDFRKNEEEKIRWANEGVAKFADILRQNTENMGEFTYEVIHNLVKYINANIGVLFLLNNDNPNDRFFELSASFAFERRKFETKRIDYGEGLVGRCAKESETIYMTEIPKDYVKIASGLGEESPNCLLLVPMKLNDEVYGVIEIASFELLEDYKIKFIEKIGESIAATISNVKINIRTAKLLEESRIKSEELASQEEEMRQNMEELQATQEEAARKTSEMESLINALNTSSFVIEYDLNGTIISVNQAYLALTEQSEKDVLGTHHADSIEFTEEQKKNYQKFWTDLRNGQVKKETNKLHIGNKAYTFIETYSPIFDENKQVKKILKIAHNISEFVSEKHEKKKKSE